ncbi:MAG TPA: long-chain fatty acid--CoA ligase [Bacillota bacterium]|jgi:long-chain acyl-CoA synthetase
MARWEVPADRPWFRHYPAGVRHSLDFPEVPVTEFLWDAASEFPDNVATIFYGNKLTYAELARYAKRFAAALRGLGVKKGDRVALMAPNCPQYVISYYAILHAGGIIAQVNPMYVESELEHLLKDSGAKVLVVFEGLLPRALNVRPKVNLEHIVVVSFGPPQVAVGEGLHRFNDLVAAYPPDPEMGQDIASSDIAVLQYTGGTTGVSRGAMLTHMNLVADCIVVREWFTEATQGKERYLTVLPLFHSYGMTCCMNMAVMMASTQALLPKFEPDDVMKTIREFQPTIFPGVPTMYVAVNHYPNAQDYNVRSIRSCVSGAAALPLEVQARFEELTGGALVEGYGLSETSPVTHVNPMTGLRKAGSIGVPLASTDAKIVDLETGERDLGVGEIGELCIRGPQVMTGYWNMPEETANVLRNGWLHTGDIAKMDEDGFFYIVDRKKDMIIAGGFNIYPRDVEEVLYQHPKVKEATVAGIPDEYLGETVKAYIVLKDGESATFEEIVDFCKERMARYKVPRQVEFRAALPKTTVGKILRRLLIEEEKQRKGAGAV